MSNNNIADLVAKLNFAKTARLKVVKVRNTKFIKQLLNYFYSLGIIHSFFILNSREISIRLKWVGGNMAFGKLILIGKPSKITNMTTKKILKTRKNNFEPMVTILSTSKGLYLDTNCILKREGGRSIIKIMIL